MDLCYNWNDANRIAIKEIVNFGNEEILPVPLFFFVRIDEKIEILILFAGFLSFVRN